MKRIWRVLFLVMLLACKKNMASNNTITGGSDYINITTDKAAYRPGEPVLLKLNSLPAGSFVRYRSLNEVIREAPLTNMAWSWTPPSVDFTGYMVEVYTKENGVEKTQAVTAIDVSSNWNKFPRYGFLSEFGQKTPSSMDSVVSFLNRYHINGLQFYDWQDKHHQPLAGTVTNPAESWKDIANRQTYKATVQGYIDRAHQYGMQAMFYNLCYGALEDGAADGVQDQWCMYKDATHTQKDFFDLSAPFKSDIFFLDPSNVTWQQYLANKNNDVYQVFNFDGYHVDQVGDRGRVYNYNGNTIDLAAAFQSFLIAMKAAHPSKKLVMNAVNQFGQQGSIANSPVDFIYSEVWAGNEGFHDLASIIQNNTAYSNGKSTVLAAYINYNRANSTGVFNNPGVLLANAVIFSFGGDHLELGEHMLCKEYFPNNNLSMNDDLKKLLRYYYDFLTGYENLLRDGGTFNNQDVTCSNGKMNINRWPPQSGSVSVQGKQYGARQVLHFINFTNANSFDWRDTDGNQVVPTTIADAALEVNYTGTATKVWVASPDINFGIPRQLVFTQTGTSVKFILPELKYWDMVVIE